MVNRLLQEYIEKYKTEFGYVQQNVKYIDQIALYQSVKVFTNYSVNIQERFVPKVKTFITQMIIKKQAKTIPKNMEKKDWVKNLQARNSIVISIRNILPDTIEKDSVAYDVHNTKKYFEAYYKLGLLYEEYNLKEFNVFPLSTSTIPRHIRFDTNILIKAILNLRGQLANGNLSVENDMDYIWNTLFNLKKKPFKSRSGMVFSGCIETDGVSVSICLEDIATHNKKKNRKGKKRKKPDVEENEPVKKTKNLDKKKTQNESVKKTKKLDKKDIPSEYFQENTLKENHVYIDPNKRDLLYCLGSNGEKLRYTQMQRRYETRSKKYSIIRKKLEEHNVNLYQQNVYGKNGLRNYNLPIPSRKLLDPIAYHGVNTTVLIGDWSRTAMKYQVPTKGKGFREMFKKSGYQVCLVNEYLTSSICPGCKTRSLEKFKEPPNPNPSKNGKVIEIHGLLRCKNENCEQMVNGNAVRDFGIGMM
ncbi:hypothetical protein HK099_005892 [Clydaea vesicula]|uniref:Transposase n=1 Tax=Clydaea vesicula TaxID=447962 RepID=A0AAD5XUN1_9FUNG|nr:hypothetical protein HK099_005892 [Clydaea vesicula]